MMQKFTGCLNKGRKQFFFEKKNQKTFAFLLESTCARHSTPMAPAISKSFLVLFFKKELLAFFLFA